MIHDSDIALMMAVAFGLFVLALALARFADESPEDQERRRVLDARERGDDERV